MKSARFRYAYARRSNKYIYELAIGLHSHIFSAAIAWPHFRKAADIWDSIVPQALIDFTSTPRLGMALTSSYHFERTSGVGNAHGGDEQLLSLAKRARGFVASWKNTAIDNARH